MSALQSSGAAVAAAFASSSASAAASSSRGPSTRNRAKAVSAAATVDSAAIRAGGPGRSSAPSAPASLSGHKRGADPAAPSSSFSASQLSAQPEAQSDAQRKKPRVSGGSAAAAASSTGFEPLAPPSAAAASQSLRKEARSAVDAVAARRQPPIAGHQPRSDMERICADAQLLIQGALAFAEACVSRCDDAAAVKQKMQQLAAAEAEPRSIPASARASRRPSKQARVDELKAWLKMHGGFPLKAFCVIDVARAAAQGSAVPAAIRRLSSLSALLDVFAHKQPPPPAQQQVLRSWFLRVDALFTRLCAAAPLLRLSQQQAQDLLVAASTAGALQLIPVLTRSQPGSEIPSWLKRGEPCLSSYCFNPRRHVVCLEPYLRLFEHGLDPTLTKAGGHPLSALQLSRKWVRDHPPPKRAPRGPMSEMQAALAESHRDTIPSLLTASATQPWKAPDAAERQRCNDLHARFMHALIAAWLSHSTKVRTLLLNAAPDRLIPPLVDIVSRYLDLEGVPAEPVAVALDEEADSQL